MPNVLTTDNPEQDSPKYRWRNHVRAELPLPGLWIAAYLPRSGAGVFLSGNKETRIKAARLLAADETLMEELPEEAEFTTASNGEPFLTAVAPADAFRSDCEKREWICAVLNQFANALRPRLKRLAEG